MIFRLPPFVSALALALSLAACTGPSLRPGGETLANDRSVVRALAVVEATQPQQTAVLAAYDAEEPRRRELERELQQLERERLALNPRQADFIARADVWIERWTRLTAERMAIQARFDQAVAKALDEGQWRVWSTLTTPRQRYGDYRDSNAVPTRGGGGY